MEINEINYVDYAEKVIKDLGENKKGKAGSRLTTTKIRNILSMVSEIYNEVTHIQGDKLSLEMVERIQYLRLRIVYESGRDQDVKNFINKSKLLLVLKNVGDSKRNFLLFCRYMEALVAYHRFYGGRDN